MGWQPVAFSEIEPFPSAVLKHRFPHVPNWGDMTKYESWPDTEVNLLVGGTPCQSFSVAGLRQGLKDPRGNLMLTFLAIADKYRPEWVIWENVPGVLSSNGGKDFESFLDGLEEIGYVCDVEILDAQNFGVAQRRKRVFVCAQSVETILSQKTILSALTIAQCLAEILHVILVETLKVYGREPLKSESVSQSRDGVERRMRLFGLLTENCNYRNWQQLLVDVFQKFPPESRNWDLPSGGKSEKELTLEDLLLGLNQDGQSTLTEGSLNKALDDLYDLMRLYTTSTLTREIMESRICMFFQIGEAIGRLICRLSGLSPNSSSTILSFLTLQTELTNYARKTSGKLFSEMDGFFPYDDFIKQAERTTSVIGNFGNRGSAAKVLFESESVSRHPAPSREKRQAAAGSTEDGVGVGSQWMSPNGADTVGTLRARDYKGPSTDSIHEGRGLAISAWWNGDQTESTVTTRSGGQYMPDKDNFGAVLTPTVIDRAAFNQGENAQYDIKIEESQVMPSLVARGPHAVTVIDRSAMNAGFDFDRDPGIEQSDTTPTLIKSGPHGVAIPIAIQDVTTRDKAQNGKGWNDDGTAYTIDTHATQGVAQPISIQGNLVGRDSGGPQGMGASVDGTMYTLTKSDVHAVAHAFKIRGGSPTETGEYGGTPGKAARKGYLGSDELAFTIAASQDQQIAYRKVRRAKSADDFETWKRDEVINTLNCFDQGDVRAVNVVLTSFGFLPTQGSKAHGLGIEQELSPTLRSGCDAYGVYQEPVAVDVYNQKTTGNVMGIVREQHGTNTNAVLIPPMAVDVYNQAIDGQVAATITEAVGGTNTSGAKVMMPNISPTITQCKGSRGGSSMEAIDEIKAIYAQQPMAIRRLTPLECERLQGFPDNWTLIPWKNKPIEDCPDGPRYKACGNSMAVPCMRWIGQRINDAKAELF
jgi:site-specific DNA-cytosine methylase